MKHNHKLVIGRIVHYKVAEDRCNAAVVTEVMPNSSLELASLAVLIDPRHVPVGQPPIRGLSNIPHGFLKDTWHWNDECVHEHPEATLQVVELKDERYYVSTLQEKGVGRSSGSDSPPSSGGAATPETTSLLGEWK